MKLLTALLAAWLLLATPNGARAQTSQPLPRVVELKAPDGVTLKASYFAAAKPGPGMLLFHQSNRNRKSWDEVAAQLAVAGINTLTLDDHGLGETGGDPKESRRQVWDGDMNTAFDYLVSQSGVTRDLIGAGEAGSLRVEDAVETARLHSSQVKSLALLSGETLPDGVQFLRQASQLPELFVFSDEDEYPPTQDAMNCFTSQHPAPARNWCTTRLPRMRRGSGTRRSMRERFPLTVAMELICSRCTPSCPGSSCSGLSPP